jgi:hypothetical protein
VTFGAGNPLPATLEYSTSSDDANAALYRNE